MARHTNRVRGPWAAYKKRPITLLGALSIGIIGIWLGAIMVNQAPQLLPAQLGLYAGPLHFFNFDTWGYLYIAMGISSVVRIPFMDYLWSWVFHAPAVLVSVSWAIGLDTGPQFTAQVLFTFFALFVVYQPWMGLTIVRLEKVAGFGVTPLGDNEMWNYAELRKKVNELEVRK